MRVAHVHMEVFDHIPDEKISRTKTHPYTHKFSTGSKLFTIAIFQINNKWGTVEESTMLWPAPQLASCFAVTSQYPHEQEELRQ